MKDYFYESESWSRARWQTFKRHGRKCANCGAESDGTIFHVDHIKPRSKFPELELDLSNLQVLCSLCNIGKGNDYTPAPIKNVLDQVMEKIRLRRLERLRVVLSGDDSVKEALSLKRKHLVMVTLCKYLRKKMNQADCANDSDLFKHYSQRFLELQRKLKEIEGSYVSGHKEIRKLIANAFSEEGAT